MINEADIQKMIDDVQNSRKYRDLDLPDAFLRDLIESETRQTQNKAKVKENFRKKLHEVIAPYLEDIDYAQESRKLITLNQSKMSETELKTYAKDLMRKHASTRERLPHLEAFYAEIWAHIGHVESVLDLACALDPLALPWYNNPSLKTFCAIDIHQPAFDLFGNLFSKLFSLCAHASAGFHRATFTPSGRLRLFVQRSPSHGKTKAWLHPPVD